MLPEPEGVPIVEPDLPSPSAFSDGAMVGTDATGRCQSRPEPFSRPGELRLTPALNVARGSRAAGAAVPCGAW